MRNKIKKGIDMKKANKHTAQVVELQELLYSWLTGEKSIDRSREGIYYKGSNLYNADDFVISCRYHKKKGGILVVFPLDSENYKGEKKRQIQDIISGMMTDKKKRMVVPCIENLSKVSYEEHKENIEYLFKKMDGFIINGEMTEKNLYKVIGICDNIVHYCRICMCTAIIMQKVNLQKPYLQMARALLHFRSIEKTLYFIGVKKEDTKKALEKIKQKIYK